jgi:predicted secreted protein
MATIGSVNGTLVMVAVEGENIACTTGATFSGTNATIDATCKDNDGAEDFLAGNQGWTISVNGNSKYDAATGISDLETVWFNKTIVTLTWGTGVTGDPYKQGEAIITAFNEEAPLNAVSTWSVTFQGKGLISRGVFT